MENRSVKRVQKALDWWEEGDIKRPTLYAEKKTGGRLKSTDFLVPGEVLKALLLAAREYVKVNQ